MVRALLVGPRELEHIAAAVQRARARPIPWDVLKRAITTNQGPVMTLADREPVEHVRPPSEIVNIPVGYRLNVSFEEQPAGMCMHVSISVNRRNKLPNPAAVKMILEACLKSTPHEPDGASQQWIEEFLIDDKPGGLAVNVVYVVTTAQGGHA